jgi:hypothetical protein
VKRFLCTVGGGGGPRAVAESAGPPAGVARALRLTGGPGGEDRRPLQGEPFFIITIISLITFIPFLPFLLIVLMNVIVAVAATSATIVVLVK